MLVKRNHESIKARPEIVGKYLFLAVESGLDLD